MDRTPQISVGRNQMNQKRGERMDIAKCVRIFEPEPDDDFVTKRNTVIRALNLKFLKKRTISDLMALGSGVCQGFCNPPSMPDAIATQVEAAIKKQSASFVQDGRDLEMSVCAAAAVVQSIESRVKTTDTWHAADVLAVALWSALSFLPACTEPKLEEFRTLAVAAARKRILDNSLETRARHDVPEFGAFGGEKTTSKTFASATASTVDALRLNAELDREEINLLWWVLGGVSEIFERPLQSLSPEVRAVTAGVEIGALMRSLPTQSHRNLALRGIEEAAPLPLPELLAVLGENRLVVATSFKDAPLIDEAPLVFPLLSAVCSGEGTGLGADLPRSLAEWGARALLERSVLQLHRDPWRR